ncbi:MAG: CehA/McbA family metallohydrolase [Planctomycetaceae bacterium]|nr:CehA/McbA family metallohydrolase [Planctomycetaceae bacterium]
MTQMTIVLLVAGLVVVGCTVSSAAAAPPSGAGAGQAKVAGVRLDQAEMTFELILRSNVAAGTDLRLRQESRLRPVIVGVFQVTGVTVAGEPLTLRDVPTFEDITGKWGQYEKYGLMAVIKAPKELPAGTKLTVRGRKYDGVSAITQRYTMRQASMWLEPAAVAMEAAAPVSEPLIVRTLSGPAQYIKAYRKADGRLLIQAFDKGDNPADSAGVTYTIKDEGGKSMTVAAAPGYELTEVQLPAPLQDAAALHVSDSAGRTCRSSALPRSLDGRAVYFGDIHVHTSFSDGDYPTADVIAWARTRIGLDFTGPGDHISEQGDFANLTYVDYARIGRQFEQTGKFCRVPALEIAGAPGHQLLMARDFESFEKAMAAYVKNVGSKGGLDSAAFCQALSAVMIPGKTMIVPAHPLGENARWPDIADKSAFGAAEIMRGPGSQESYEKEPQWHAGGRGGKDDSSIRHALSLGYKLAFTGDSDNHRPLPGQPQAVYHGITAVQAEKLDTAGVFDAIAARRCYATSGARIVGDARLNDAPIGSDVQVAPEQPRKFTIVIHGTASIAETQIIHCGKVLKTFKAASDQHDVTVEWTHTPPASDKAPSHEYYYIRVRQTDGHCAWLSPFYIQ